MATEVKACKQCNTEMSKSLRRCPNCGCRHITTTDWTIGIVLVAIIVVIVYSLLK
jgi:RNA polymerase subunit RPABC4/transcription elongation factor Spt4